MCWWRGWSKGLARSLIRRRWSHSDALATSKNEGRWVIESKAAPVFQRRGDCFCCFGKPVRFWQEPSVTTLKNTIQNYRCKGQVKQKSVNEPRLGYMQVVTRQCWNWYAVFPILRGGGVDGLPAALGCCHHRPDLQLVTGGGSQPAGSELPIGTQPRMPTTNPLSSGGEGR